jgi:hypothetical protein
MIIAKPKINFPFSLKTRQASRVWHNLKRDQLTIHPTANTNEARKKKETVKKQKAKISEIKGKQGQQIGNTEKKRN